MIHYYVYTYISMLGDAKPVTDCGVHASEDFFLPQ